ncbi:hypothetical protein [Trueperella pyogenes]|uniref:hypothetical protein n=1 Tax=Trueperella pyogenes TaxID=1661 RepID=UPI003CC91165
MRKIREQVGDKHAICGLSGGVDSSVAAALVHKAIGEQLTCVFVDHGLLRKGEAEQVVVTTPLRSVSGWWQWTSRSASERARRRDRPRDQAQDHRPRVHPFV